MKRTIAAVLLFSTALLAEAGFFFGAGGGQFTESMVSPTMEKDADTTYYRLKAGYGDPRAYGVEVSLSYFDYKQDIFSEGDGRNLYFDINIIKAFDFGIGFYPFLKAGFGGGYLQVKRELEETLGNGGFQAGGGVLYPVGEHLEIELQLLYRGKSWEQANLIAERVEVTSSVVEPYFGINYRF